MPQGIQLEDIQISTSLASVSESASIELSTPKSSEDLLKERMMQFECKAEAIESLKSDLYAAIEQMGEVPPTTCEDTEQETNEGANTSDTDNPLAEDEPTECEQEGAVFTDSLEESVVADNNSVSEGINEEAPQCEEEEQVHIPIDDANDTEAEPVKL